MTDKFIFRFIAAVTVFVFLVVVLLESKVLPAPAHIPAFIWFLPKLNAILNGTCSVILVTSLFFIARREITVHKWLNITAFILSSLFLVSYILFHYMAPVTLFGDLDNNGFVDEAEKAAAGSARIIYLTILTSHIILAACVLPLILLSFYRGLNMQVVLHRRLVRWSYPMWLYVTITGVIVYLMISPYYPHS